MAADNPPTLIPPVPTRITAGQAHAVFESQFTGGAAIRDNPAAPGAAPLANDLKPVVMSPISSSPDDPFCVLDWHVIRVLLASDVRADLVGSNVRIWLDGAPIAVTRTAIKPFGARPRPLHPRLRRRGPAGHTDRRSAHTHGDPRLRGRNFGERSSDRERRIGGKSGMHQFLMVPRYESPYSLSQARIAQRNVLIRS
jgi:hypothetical protein